MRGTIAAALIMLAAAGAKAQLIAVSNNITNASFWIYVYSKDDITKWVSCAVIDLGMAPQGGIAQSYIHHATADGCMNYAGLDLKIEMQQTGWECTLDDVLWSATVAVRYDRNSPSQFTCSK